MNAARADAIRRLDAGEGARRDSAADSRDRLADARDAAAAERATSEGELRARAEAAADRRAAAEDRRAAAAERAERYAAPWPPEDVASTSPRNPRAAGYLQELAPSPTPE